MIICVSDIIQLGKSCDISNVMSKSWQSTTKTIGSPKIGVESSILMIEHILVSTLFDLTRATLLSLRNTLTLLYYIIVMLMYYVMTTMWRALNQRGLRRVYAQSLI